MGWAGGEADVHNFDNEMLERWYELKEIVSSVVYDQECDALVWAYESKEYILLNLSMQSLTLEGCTTSISPLFGR